MRILKDKDKPKKKRLPSIPKLKKKAQELFNAFIRERDKDRTCISCDKLGNQAGHYFATKGYDGLRFDEDNCHLQCPACNCYLHGNIQIYSKRLIERIGKPRYDALFERAMEYKRNGHKWTRDELFSIIEKYKT
jgi:hypothetical protein